MGHALNNSLQDAVIRFKRMKGFNCSWFPGTDHAGIATQNVVERELEKQGTSRHEIGREEFIKRVWKWKEKHGSRIIEQLKILGCSCDWDRERFTFDDNYVKAVNREFVTLYNDGLIYRGNYMVNWCPRCQTAVSDIEVEHHDKHGNLWDIRYPVIDDKTGKPDSGQFLVVSTTRPETMLGDTAVAVHPKDKRYTNLIGKYVFLPIAKRKIPVIADEYVDMKFGTGAVKVTPSHDPNDFAIGQRHGLEKINIMNDDATLNENAGSYEGLDRFEARKKILDELEKTGFLLGKKEHISSVGSCSRCATIIEPRISLQWYVSMKKLAIPAIEAVKSGRIKFVPKKWEKLYFNWMENIRDWCISRQLWWGHRIPVWYCDDCNEVIVTEEEPQKCTKCNSINIRQDEDVLDTWFSSDMWPFAVMGWPDDTEELHYFFPTSVLITAHDIIFFWVARMIMMSLYFMKEIPFKEVFINPLVNDEKGQKMSKSKGNVIDPVSIVEKYGCDVLRYTLAALTTPGKNLLLGEEKIEGTRNFANKIWNASKFVISAVKDADIDFDKEPAGVKLNIWDKWILEKLSVTIKNYERYIEKYNFSFASKILYNFFWNEFCDWYIEAAKVKIYGDDIAGKNNTSLVLYYVLERFLRIMHPIMPFLTERIWQSLPSRGESIMILDFPKALKKQISAEESRELGHLFEIISAVRKSRSELNISPASKIKLYFNSAGSNNDNLNIIRDNENYLKVFCKASDISYLKPSAGDSVIKITIDNTEIFVDLSEAVDYELEIKRIKTDIRKLDLELIKSENKINNPDFLSRAPEAIVNKEKNKAAELKKNLETLESELEKIKKAMLPSSSS
jgi:valyl-tRNA synthetase